MFERMTMYDNILCMHIVALYLLCLHRLECTGSYVKGHLIAHYILCIDGL